MEIAENMAPAAPLLPETAPVVPVVPAAPGTALAVPVAPAAAATPVAAAAPVAAVTPAVVATVPGIPAAAPAAATVPGIPAAAAPAVLSTSAPAVPAVPAAPANIGLMPAFAGVPATGENPAPGETPALDSDLAAQILQRLDQLIALLSAAGAAADEDPEASGTPEHPENSNEKQTTVLPGDEDPATEIAAAVEEAVAEALENSGETLPDPMDSMDPLNSMNPGDPLNPNDPLNPILDEEGQEGALAEEINELIQAVVEPSIALEEGAETEDPQRSAAIADAVREAMRTVRPMLARMPAKKRAKVCQDIAGHIRKQGLKSAGKPGNYLGIYARSGRDRRAADPSALGKKIMASRNANMKRGV